jgi:hypothetical protein
MMKEIFKKLFAHYFDVFFVWFVVISFFLLVYYTNFTIKETINQPAPNSPCWDGGSVPALHA